MLTSTLTQGARLVFAGTHARAADVRPHAHPCPELILVADGACDVDWDGGTLHGGSGDVLAIPARAVHNQVSNGYVETVYVGFTAPAATAWREPAVLRVGDCAFVRSCMSLLASVHFKQVTAAEPAADAVVAAVLEQLYARQQQIQRTSGVPVGLSAALRYIEDHLSEPLTVAEIAASAGMSVSNLHLLFRTRLNSSPMHHLVQQRMQAACGYLQNPYLLVKQVATRCGYPDVNHFIRTFRVTFGQSPRRWRQLHQSPGPQKGPAPTAPAPVRRRRLT